MSDSKTYLKTINTGAPSGLLRFIITIPVFCEPELRKTLQSILNQTEFQAHTEVLLVFNYPENASSEIKEQNNQQYIEINSWAKKVNNDTLRFIPILANDLPAKHAGAGFARKTGMDFAADRFQSIKQPGGFILSLDADSILSENYLQETERILKEKEKTNTLIYNFAHPTEGTEYNKQVYKAVALYELHLRYYKYMLKSTGFPYYHYTIGSCFGVKAEIYSKSGGMSKRKAGEDFYFLQKVFPYGHVEFLPDTFVYPSPRPSWRVPFGTGPTIRKLLNSPIQKYETYHPESFRHLTMLFEQADKYYLANADQINELNTNLNSELVNFLDSNNFNNKIAEISGNTSSRESFIKRFYQWFDAFMLIRFLNWHRDNCCGTIDVVTAVKEILKLKANPDTFALLNKLRQLDIPTTS
ncbi:MAG: glycosyltransferase family 2 protein [Bacteroidales bacterium]|nr:glycosyltransferase family 2 protein [Bacteroidales bacterium]MBN2818495.1 glycosyltransferase family 2 protein [Bacteroidales bacterium]